MSKEADEPKEPRVIGLARRHVQMHEIVGSDGLQDRMVTFDYFAKYGTDSEEFMNAARRFIKEGRRLLIPPSMTGGEDE